MHNKDKVIYDKKLQYEYNIYLYILEKLWNKGVIDVKAVNREQSSGVSGETLYQKYDKAQSIRINIHIK